jgi:3-hydroxyacyl-[acyl-carrier-protein] dehydratase
MSAPEARRYDRQQIEEFIPHRDPFLWLDEVVSLEETRIHARKQVPEDLDVFRGHYPGFPVLPGVLQCEAAFQAGAVLIARRIESAEGKVPVVTRLNNVQFRRMVRPGETLDVEAELTETLANAFFLKGKVSVNGQVSVRLEFACAAAVMDGGRET